MVLLATVILIDTSSLGPMDYNKNYPKNGVNPRHTQKRVPAAHPIFYPTDYPLLPNPPHLIFLLSFYFLFNFPVYLILLHIFFTPQNTLFSVFYTNRSPYPTPATAVHSCVTTSWLCKVDITDDNPTRSMLGASQCPPPPPPLPPITFLSGYIVKIYVRSGGLWKRCWNRFMFISFPTRIHSSPNSIIITIAYLFPIVAVT